MTTNRNSDYLLARALEAGMTDPRELAVFMAQMQVESGGFSQLSENFHYSGRRLLEVFGKRNAVDSLAAAEALAGRGPEAVANSMYGGEWGKRLGNTEPGDGWRFRGRGFVQITGRSNYEHFGRVLGIDLASNPEQAATPEVAAAIAVEYWRERVVPHNSHLDVARATKVINGGRQGLRERERAASEWGDRLQTLLPDLLAAPTQHSAANSAKQSQGVAETIGPGTRGPATAELQSLLDRLGYRDDRGQRLREDGDFGQRTGEALKAFQRAHGLSPVGYVGPKTHAAIEAARRDGPSPLDPAHPDHALQQQVSHALEAMERSLGRTADAGTARLGAALLVAARQAGLGRVDHVLLGVATTQVQAGANAFVVQGAPEDPASRRAHVSTRQALATPVDASWTRLAQVQTPQRGEPAQAWAHAHPLAMRQGEHAEGARRVPAP